MGYTMGYFWADLCKIVHLLIIIYIVGGMFVPPRKFPRFANLHRILFFGAFAVHCLMGFRCPLTLLENYLRGIRNLSEPFTVMFFRETFGLAVPEIAVNATIILGAALYAVIILAQKRNGAQTAHTGERGGAAMRITLKSGLAVFLVISLVSAVLYLAIEKSRLEWKVNYVYRESNAYMSSEGDVNGPYEISRTILDAFRNLPREDMVKSMEKAVEKLRASGNEREYYNALLKIGHEYEMLGWKKKAVNAYAKYLKKYPDSQGAYFDVRMAIESLSKELKKGGKTVTRQF